MSAPLNLSLTKLSSKKRRRRLVHDGAGMDSTTVFPGGDDMLDALTRLQTLQEKLIDQLEVVPSPDPHSIVNQCVYMCTGSYGELLIY